MLHLTAKKDETVVCKTDKSARVVVHEAADEGVDARVNEINAENDHSRSHEHKGTQCTPEPFRESLYHIVGRPEQKPDAEDTDDKRHDGDSKFWCLGVA